ncbi:MAG: transporter substrate-binding domain-containing protein [Cellvibrio sp.]|uniref:substrate-binding periplasmic protein n=1 Tax=Cellvibrio sp. TaxID=1965322 RepID=UPI00272846C6|nr:transporter substrate-binding domain-containing protein [Cellvibrio sp.]
MSKSRAYAWLLLCALAIQVCAESPTPGATDDSIRIHLGAEDSWPPYSDAKGQGISTDLIKAAFAKSGLTPTLHVLPYARVLHDLASGKIDGGYNVTLQSTTQDKYIFGQVPLLRVEAYWFFIPDMHPTIKSIADIPDKFRVGVIRDYEYGDIYENHRRRFTEVQVSQQSQIIRMLKQGRIDAAVMFDREAEFALKEMNLDAAIFDKRFLNHIGDVYVAFSHKSPRARWLAEQLDKGLLMMKETGEYDRILSDTNKEQ